MQAAVLAYGYDGREMRLLKAVCARLDVRPRRVDPAEYGRPVGSFFGLSPAGTAAPAAGELTGRQMDAFLSALRMARAGDSLKAVLTEHNAAWTGPALYGELAEEHRRMQQAVR